MTFIETSVFTRVVEDLLTLEEYRVLQTALILRPRLGSAIPKGGGLRKTRWSVPGAGKRGGIRVIYYWHEEGETFLMLYAFRKNEQENLSQRQLRFLSTLVEEEFK
jgi:hypothetical protein